MPRTGHQRLASSPSAKHQPRPLDSTCPSPCLPFHAHNFNLHLRLYLSSEPQLLVRARDCRQPSAAKPPFLPAWRLAPVRRPYCKAFDTAGWIRGLRVFDSRIFGVILKQGTGSRNKAGLAVHDLARAAAATEPGLLFATDAKARVGGLPLPLHRACVLQRGIVLSTHLWSELMENAR
jgi:hypothetical protein